MIFYIYLFSGLSFCSAGADANNLVDSGAGKDTIFLSKEAVSGAEISIMGDGGDDSVTFNTIILTNTEISNQIGISNFSESHFQFERLSYF